MLRRTNKLVIELLGAFMVVLLLVLALVYARLTTGPMSIEWTVTALSAIASRDSAGGRVDISGAQISFAEGDGALQVSFDSAVYHSADDHLFTARNIVFEPDMAALIGRFSLRPLALSVAEISITTKTQPQNARALYFAGLREVAGLLEALPIGRGLGGFKFFRIENILIQYGDQRKIKGLPKSFITFERKDDALVLDARVLYRGAGGDVSAIVSGEMPIGSAGEIDLKLDNIRLNELASVLPVLEPFSGQSAPIAVSGMLTLDADRSLLGANLLAQVGEGTLLLGDKSFGLKQMTSRLDVDVKQKSVFVSQGDVTVDNYQAAFSGAFSYKTNSEGALAVIDGSVSSEQFSIDFEDSNPIRVGRNSALEFIYRVDEGMLSIARAETDLSGIPLRLKGDLDFGTADPLIDLTLNLGETAADNVLTIWPERVAIRTRGWVAKNISGGEINAGQIMLKGRLREFEKYSAQELPAENILSGYVDVSNIRLKYLSQMPEMIVLKGRLKTTAQQFSASVETGFVDVEGGDSGSTGAYRQMISNGSFVAPVYFDRDGMAKVRFDVSGDLASLLRVADTAPLSVLKNAPIKPIDVIGETDVSVRLAFPLGRRLEREDVAFEVKAYSERASLTKPLSGYRFEDADMNLHVTSKKISFTGNVLANKVPVIVSGEAPVGQPASSNFLTVSGRLNATARALQQLHLTALARQLDGNAPTKFDLDFQRDGNRIISFDADLTQSNVKPEAIVYLKPVDIKARLVGDVSLNRSGILTHLKGDYTSALGDHINFDMQAPRGILSSLSVSPAKLGDDYDFTVSTRDEDGIPYFVLRGDVINVAQFLRSRPLDQALKVSLKAGDNEDREDAPAALATSHAEKRLKPTLKIPALPHGYGADVRIAKLKGAYGDFARSFQVDLIQAYGRVEKATIAANFDDGTEIYGDLFRDEGVRRRFLIQAENGSHVLRALNIVPGIEGGAFSLSGELYDFPLMKDDKAISGQASFAISNYKLRKVPLLAQLLSLASFAGLSDTLSGSGLRFNKTAGNLTWHQGRLKIDRGLATGDGLGISFQGAVDQPTNRISMGGTIVPAYGLNALLGRIPLVGPIFSGREGEGLIGVSYRIFGKASEPTVFVNPVSVVTPGFTRRLFDLGTGNLGGELPDANEAER